MSKPFFILLLVLVFSLLATPFSLAESQYPEITIPKVIRGDVAVVIGGELNRYGFEQQLDVDEQVLTEPFGAPLKLLLNPDDWFSSMVYEDDGRTCVDCRTKQIIFELSETPQGTRVVVRAFKIIETVEPTGEGLFSKQARERKVEEITHEPTVQQELSAFLNRVYEQIKLLYESKGRKLE